MADIVKEHSMNLKLIPLWMLTAAIALLCFLPTLQWMNFKFQTPESYYSHGYLIPFVSAYLIYIRRGKLQSLPRPGSPSGLWLILGALALHVFGILGDIHFISGFALILYTFGVCFYIFGRAWTGCLAFPLLFLFFMCPLPDNIINVIALPSKSLATTLSLYFLDLLDIPYIREGFRIHLADSTYVVGTPCNGMRSLISFLALGILFVYFIRAATWKKAVFLAFIPPLSIVLNGIRIAILLYIANRFGQEAASPESYLHDGSGFLVFIFGLMALMLLYRIFNEERT